MKIKVFFFIDSFRIGGMHKQVLYLAKHLSRENFDPIICVQSSAGGLYTEFENSGARIISLHWTRRLEFGVFKRFISVLKKEQPQLIFITAPQNLFYYRIACFFYFGKTIQIGSFRAMNFWMGHLGEVYKPIDSFLTRLMIFTSKLVVVNSEAMEERYSHFLPEMSKKKIRVIYNGSDFNFPISKSADVLRNELMIAPTDIIVTMIARLDPWKDFEAFLTAAAIVVVANKHVKILLIGDGSLRTELENKIIQLQLQNNMFIIGEKKDIYNYINLTDISVLSTKGEGFSNSILESMAFAKPVVATDVGGNAELLGRTSEHGFLVPPNSPIIFAETLNKLINSEGLRKQIGFSAKQRIEKICNLKSFVLSYEEIFEKAILK